MTLCTASKIRVVTAHCSPREGVEGGAPVPGDFRAIVCPTPPQMNYFCDLLGTPDTPVSKIASVKSSWKLFSLVNINLGLVFFLTSFSETLYFLKLCPILKGSTLCLFTKCNLHISSFIPSLQNYKSYNR